MSNYNSWINEHNVNDLLKGSKDVIPIPANKYVQSCEVNQCRNQAAIKINARNYVTNEGADNDIYMCLEHFTRMKKLMNVDIDRIKRRRDNEAKFGLRARI